MSSVSQIHTIEQQLLLACLPDSPDIERLTILLKQNPDWDELHSQGLRHGVLPQIYQTLKDCPSSLVPTPVLKNLQNWFATHTLRNLQMQNELQRQVSLLTGEGISVIPFKGPTLAEEAYGDIALRSFADLDLLVPPDQARDAARILLAQGYQTDFDLSQERWTGLQRVENHLPLYHPEQNWSVEIHWSLFHPMYALPFDLSAYWPSLECGKVGRLEREETLVMLCAHGTKHFWEQLKWLVDIDRLVGNQLLVISDQLSVARCSGSVRALLLGLNLSRTLLGTPLCDEIAERINDDHVIRALTADAVANLFPEDSGQKRYLQEYVFYLKSRDNFGDRLRQILRWLFWPRRADWEVFRLGDRCHWFYYVQRPVRMFAKYVLRPVFTWTWGEKNQNLDWPR
jgi:hypothetical protein